MKEGGARRDEEKKLREACEGFEAIFVAQLLASADPGEGQGILGGGVADKVFRAQFNDALAGAVAKRGALGIADMLYEELKASPPRPPSPRTSPVALRATRSRS